MVAYISWKVVTGFHLGPFMIRPHGLLIAVVATVLFLWWRSRTSGVRPTPIEAARASASRGSSIA